tara:strand:- start:5310 stop:5612 length:303 start_codon:yes stop_codon:yes gene_type:complete
MNLEQVIANLERTIQGKRGFLFDSINFYTGGDGVAERVTSEFLRVNISELERILTDLKQVLAAQHSEQAASSWKENPDRMGGCYTSDEIAESRSWRGDPQ